MPDDYNLGIDSAYNARLRAQLRELEHMDVITHNPQWLGGGPVRQFVLSGNNGAYPIDAERLSELQAMGGAFSLKDLRPVARVLKSKPVRQVGEKILDLAVKRAVGGKINRLKKATRWTGYAADTVNKGLDLATKGAKVSKLFGFGEFQDDEVGGKINRLKKAKRWTAYAADTASKGLDLVSKAAPLAAMVGLGARSDLPAGTASTKKHMQALRDGQKRDEIFVSGSKEAKEYMAKLRGMRTKKPKAAKRPAGARALIVKQVMSAKGLGMIEASKYVKANNLYQKQ
jgi:hypothetical protein